MAWLCAACVIADNGDFLYIDENHPGAPKSVRQAAKNRHAGGPGTEARALLARFGLTADGDCKCNARANYMDQMGCDWCASNIEEIIGWLRESAAARNLPFVGLAARLLVRRAIANARRKSNLTQ